MVSLHECLDNKQYNKLQLLVELGYDPNELDRLGKNLLMKAVEKIIDNEIRLRIIEALITVGANVNYQDINGNTALMIACGKGLMPEVEFLLKNNANINLCNKDEHSALSYACWGEFMEVVVFLIANKANTKLLEHIYRRYHISTYQPNRDIALFWVAKWLNSTWLYACLQNIRDINITDKNGESLLFHALHDIDSVRILLKSGININIRNHKGEAVLTHAKKYFHGRHPKLVQLLVDNGAKE